MASMNVCNRLSLCAKIGRFLKEDKLNASYKNMSVMLDYSIHNVTNIVIIQHPTNVQVE